VLRYLSIRNFVLIDRAEIEFSPGLNVLTGETGAGKSIVLAALGLLLGDRAAGDLAGGEGGEAVVEARFEYDRHAPEKDSIDSILDLAGIDREEGTLLLSRTVSADGRSRLFINNRPALVRVLKELGTVLVDLHGQHEHQSLLRRATYRAVVDRYGVDPQFVSHYNDLYVRRQHGRDRLASLEGDERERRRREDILRYQIHELEAAKLQIGEEEELDRELRIMQHAEKLAEQADRVYRNLYEGDGDRPSVLDELSRLHHVVQEMSLLDEGLKGIYESWIGPISELEELAREIRHYSHNIEFDPQRLEERNERKRLIQDLKAKYGDSVADLLQYLESAKIELGQIANREEEIEQLRKELSEIEQEIGRATETLLKERRRVGEQLSSAIAAELSHLGMKGAQFVVSVEPTRDSEGIPAGEFGPVRPGPGGADEIEFLLSTIPNRSLRPLREVASGGEISRIMLAIKYILGKTHLVPTMIFDEIDLGIGGTTADVIAQRLQDLSNEKQVICITHLPQIAARAETNLRVVKTATGKTARTRIEHLSGTEREDEIVRMLGGEEASRSYAREMLSGFKKGKKRK